MAGGLRTVRCIQTSVTTSRVEGTPGNRLLTLAVHGLRRLAIRRMRRGVARVHLAVRVFGQGLLWHGR